MVRGTWPPSRKPRKRKANVCNAAKIPFSDAYGFGVFYYHGEKSVMPDLTLTYTDGVLNATLKLAQDDAHIPLRVVDTLKGARVLLQGSGRYGGR